MQSTRVPGDGEVSDEVVVALLRAYARQSRLIDSGEAAGWAATFTADGEFHSPSYPEPAVGEEELRAFAQRFADAGAASGITSRHVVTNVDVLPGETDGTALAHAYLQIVATDASGDSSLVRLTCLTDRWVLTDGRWLLAHRRVTRDGATSTASAPTPTPATGTSGAES